MPSSQSGQTGSPTTPDPFAAILGAAAGHTLPQVLAQTFLQLLMFQRLRFRTAVAETGLSLAQAGALQHIAEHPATMRDLARAALCEPSNLTGIIDKLEARGLVERKPSPEDRRIKYVSLTRAGIAFRKRLLSRFSEPSPWMLALSQTDQQRMLSLLRKALVLAQRTTTEVDS